MEISIRRIAAGEGALLQDVRLRALGDSPAAFASTFDEEAGHDDAYWSDRARQGAAGDDTASFVAVQATAAVGLVVGFHPDRDRPVVELVAMWTAPAVRRLGVARRLVEALVGWAHEASAEAVELWVTEGNAAAITLYRSLGFEPTGERGPLPSDPSLEELRMRRPRR